MKKLRCENVKINRMIVIFTETQKLLKLNKQQVRRVLAYIQQSFINKYSLKSQTLILCNLFRFLFVFFCVTLFKYTQNILYVCFNSQPVQQEKLLTAQRLLHSQKLNMCRPCLLVFVVFTVRVSPLTIRYFHTAYQLLVTSRIFQTHTNLEHL